MTTTINEITGLVVGEYGVSHTLTVVDADGTAIDLSSYTGITLKARSPDHQSTLSFTGALVGGGTSGQFSFAPGVANTFDRSGVWDGQVSFTKASVLALTVIFKLHVDPAL